MKRGLVIGKFMPLHRGHVALIRFAAEQCDQVIVSITHKPEDPIPGSLRVTWLKSEFEDEQKIEIRESPDDFDDESLSYPERMPRWVNFLKSRFPEINVVFSSEEYGSLLAAALGIEHIQFDPHRKQFPVSGRLIRNNPFRYWEFIASPARSFFVKKICFFGPESTGKSTMAKKLADHYNTEFVPEVSRELITSNDFTREDIIRIGKAQTARVLEKVSTANKLLFCDTDLITTEIYSQHYLHEIPPILLVLEKQIVYDRYFLFGTDVPWVSDGLRDLGEMRDEMFQVFKQALEMRKISYELLHGDFVSREAQIRRVIDAYFV